MMDEGEIPGSLWSSSSSPSHDNMHQSESWLNLLLLVQQFSSSADSTAQDVDSEVVITGTNQLQSSNSATQDVDFEEEDAVSVTGTNQVNLQFNVVNNTQFQPPIANTNVFQFTAKIIENSDEAKRQRRKQANLKSARQSRKRRQDVMKNTEKEVEHLKKIALELSLACLERKEKCDTSHCWNRVAIMDRVAIIARVYTFEKQLMRVTGFHPLDDPYFISIAKNAGLNLSDVRSLIHAPTYLTSPIPPYLNQLVSTFSNAPHHTGLQGAMPSWDNNQ